MKVTVNDSIENAPKKQLIRDINVAFGEGNKDAILNCFSDDITWTMVGVKTVVGKEDVAKVLDDIENQAEELIIDHIVINGNKCAANGMIFFPDKTKIAFCDMYEFSGSAKAPKIRSLSSYALSV